MFCQQNKDGYISRLVSPLGRLEGRSQPPLLDWVVHEHYNKFGDKYFVSEMFENTKAKMNEFLRGDEEEFYYNRRLADGTFIKALYTRYYSVRNF